MEKIIPNTVEIRKNTGNKEINQKQLNEARLYFRITDNVEKIKRSILSIGAFLLRAGIFYYFYFAYGIGALGISILATLAVSGYFAIALQTQNKNKKWAKIPAMISNSIDKVFENKVKKIGKEKCNIDFIPDLYKDYDNKLLSVKLKLLCLTEEEYYSKRENISLQNASKEFLEHSVNYDVLFDDQVLTLENINEYDLKVVNDYLTGGIDLLEKQEDLVKGQDKAEQEIQVLQTIVNKKIETENKKPYVSQLLRVLTERKEKLIYLNEIKQDKHLVDEAIDKYIEITNQFEQAQDSYNGQYGTTDTPNGKTFQLIK